MQQHRESPASVLPLKTKVGGHEIPAQYMPVGFDMLSSAQRNQNDKMKATLINIS